MARIPIALACASTIARAASGKISEQRIRQARDEAENVAHFRIKIERDARIAKTSYRSDLYDCEALDALLSSVTGDEAGVPKALTRAQRNHDCSRRGGNSDSAVAEFETGRAVGLHFLGEYEREDFAVRTLGRRRRRPRGRLAEGGRP